MNNIIEEVKRDIEKQGSDKSTRNEYGEKVKDSIKSTGTIYNGSVENGDENRDCFIAKVSSKYVITFSLDENTGDFENLCGRVYRMILAIKNNKNYGGDGKLKKIDELNN